MGGNPVIAIIMAGGRGSRMGKDVEKPLLEIGGKKMLDLVVDAVKGATVEGFFVATSPETPNTKEYCQERGYTVLETEGKGYHEDVIALLEKYPVFVSVAADIPFLKSSAIDRLVENYDSTSVSGAMPIEIIPETMSQGYTFKHDGKLHAPVGINVVTCTETSKIVSFDDWQLGINVNTSEELELAREMAEK